jgi:hypothetical protein
MFYRLNAIEASPDVQFAPEWKKDNCVWFLNYAEWHKHGYRQRPDLPTPDEVSKQKCQYDPEFANFMSIIYP